MQKFKRQQTESLIKAPSVKDSAVQRGACSFVEGDDHLVLCDFGVDEAPQCRRFAGEELHSAFGNTVPVTDIGVQEVSGTADHITHVRLLDVLCGAEGGLKQLYRNHTNTALEIVHEPTCRLWS